MKLSPRGVQFLRESLSPPEMSLAVSLLTRDSVQVLRTTPSRDGSATAIAIARDSYGFHSMEIRFFANGEVGGRCGQDDGMCLPFVVAAALVLDTLGSVPDWKSELDQLLPHRQAAPQPLCLFLATSYATADQGDDPRDVRPELRARPGMLGSRSTWIKGRAGWDQLTSGDFDENAASEIDQLRMLYRSWATRRESAYYGSYYGHPEWIPLSELPGRQLGAALQRIRDAGVPVLSYGRKPLPVTFSDRPAHHEITVTTDDDGLRLDTRISVEQKPVVLEDAYFLGQPARWVAHVPDAGASPESITLHPASSPIDDSFQRISRRREPLRIPQPEQAAFEADYLPRLQSASAVTSPDGSYEVPAKPRTTLRLTLAFHAPKLHLSWTWRRPPGMESASAEREIADAVTTVLGTVDGEATLSDRILSTGDAALFVTETLPLLRDIDGLEIEESTKTPDFRATVGLPAIAVSSEREGDWFDLHFTVTVDGEEVDFADLFTALSLDESVYVLPDGRFFSLDRPEFATLREVIAEARSLVDRPPGEVRISQYQVDMWAELTELGIIAAQEAEWWLALQTLGSDTVQPIDPSPALRATLRDYQKHGLSWLHFLRTHGLGGVLADDMGLGKTLQTIAMIQLAVEESPERAPFLVVAPTSVVGNWSAEVRKFAPELDVRTITSMSARRGAHLSDAIAGAHIVVTSYALFRLEAEDYRSLTWSGLILDEAQQIKNHASHGHRAARMLGAPFTLVITGTPMENNLLELWSLVSLAAPGLLGSRQKFSDYYRAPIEREKNTERLALLKRRISPFLLRRTKDLVAGELPLKQEQVVTVELHPKHRRAYDVRFQRERQKLLGLVDDVKANRFEIFRSLTMLRQLALDPSLVDAGDAPSAKIDTLVDILTEAASEGHRVLVLSQFTRFLRIAHRRAQSEGVNVEYLDGETTNRQSVIDRFRGGEATAFFLSLRAAGFGLNLTEADYVVLLDPWWNPAVEAQAIDRAHRIGQRKPVFVFRLVSADTIEDKVVALRAAKAELFARVFDADGEAGSTQLTADDIRGLLEE